MKEELARKALAAAMGLLVVAVSALSVAQGKAPRDASPSPPCVAFLSTRTGSVSLLSQASGLYTYSSDLFISNYEGDKLLNVTNDPSSRPAAPQWSPDGTTLAWLSTSGIEIFTGHDRRTLVRRDTFAARLFTWSPKSDAIAMFGKKLLNGRATATSAVFVVYLPGGEPTKLMDVPDVRAMRWIENPSSVVVCTMESAVLVAPARRGGYVNVPKEAFRPPRKSFALDLAVSPDSRLGALSLEAGDAQDVRSVTVFHVDGSASYRLLESTDLRQIFPSWSPADGNLMAFLGERQRQQALYICQTDSGAARRVEPPKPYGTAGFFSWSGDGAAIAFQCARADRPEGAAANILILDVATMTVSTLAGLTDTFDSSPACRPERAARPMPATAPTFETTAPVARRAVQSTGLSVETTGQGGEK